MASSHIHARPIPSTKQWADRVRRYDAVMRAAFGPSPGHAAVKAFGMDAVAYKLMKQGSVDIPAHVWRVLRAEAAKRVAVYETSGDPSPLWDAASALIEAIDRDQPDAR